MLFNFKTKLSACFQNYRGPKLFVHSCTIDIVSKSAQITHLTAEPILKQCAVYGSRPPIASKPGSSSLEQYGLNNITSQPCSDATCPRTTSDSAYFRFVTLF